MSILAWGLGNFGAEQGLNPGGSGTDEGQIIPVDDFAEGHVSQCGGNLIGPSPLDSADFIRGVVGQAAGNFQAAARLQTDEGAGFEIAQNGFDPDGEE